MGFSFFMHRNQLKGFNRNERSFGRGKPAQNRHEDTFMMILILIGT